MRGIALGNGQACGGTKAALRASLDDWPGTWIPRSVIHDDSEVYEIGHEGKVVVAEWWADANGFSAAGKRQR